MNKEEKLVKRADKRAYYGVPGTDGTTVFHRMTGFTQLNNSRNAKEYTRQYVDEEFENTDVVGYSPEKSYSFDQYDGNAVHADIAAITENEMTGSDAIRTILVVDLLSKDKNDQYKATQRDWAVIPDSDGDGFDAYIYTGTFKSKSGKKDVSVTLAEDESTATIVTVTATEPTE